ncbi:MAG: class I SAM-dependent methyltransferase [Candidatus Woesearchaeota archaeon]
MTDHYFSKKPKSDPKYNIIEVQVNNTIFKFKTGTGVFSKHKVDRGSLLLIEKPILGKKILDFGCGYGPIGIIIKKIYPDCNVTCSDINERAIKLTQENAITNNVEIKIIQSDLFKNVNGTFDTIFINLPQNAGKDICFKMIKESYEHLNEEGTLQTVSRHQKGGKQYEKYMLEIFGNVDTLSRGSGYKVYISKK